LHDRLGAIDSSRKGYPFGAPIDLWTGLDHVGGIPDDLYPLEPVKELAYVGDYDQTRQILINTYNMDEPGSDDMISRGYYSTLDYLVNRGVLEALAGDIEGSIYVFRKSPRTYA